MTLPLPRPTGSSTGSTRPKAAAASLPPKPPEGGAENAPPPPPPPTPAELQERYEKLRRAVQAEPANRGHRLLLADTCLALRRREEATAVLLRAIEDLPETRPEALRIFRTYLDEGQVAGLPLREPAVPFWNDAARVLRYPIAGNGPVLLVGGAIVFSVLSLLVQTTSIFFWLPLSISLGYLSSYLMSIIQSSGRGGREPPDYPDFTNFGDSILGPLWTAVCSALIPMALPIAWVSLFGSGPVVLILLLAGLLYWPMALIAGSLYESCTAPLNTALVIRGIRITAREYFPAVLTIYGLSFASWLVSLGAHAFLHPLLSTILVQGTGLYFLMAEMNILGRIFYNHEKELGWFVSPKRRDRDPPSR